MTATTLKIGGGGAVNLGDFLAELEAQRARLDTAIAGLRPLIEAATPAPNGATAPKRDFPKRASKIGTARAAKSAKPAKVRRTSTAQADWKERVWAMRAAGEKGPAIAAALKLPAWKVYQLKDKPKAVKVAAEPDGDRTIDPKTKRPWV